MNANTKIICEEYLAFIRAKPCCVCGAPPPNDADHLKARGLGSGKQNDLTACPMCRRCHAERHQIGLVAFVLRHNVDLWQQATMLLIEFFADPDRRVTVEIKVSER